MGGGGSTNNFFSNLFEGSINWRNNLHFPYRTANLSCKEGPFFACPRYFEWQFMFWIFCDLLATEEEVWCLYASKRNYHNSPEPPFLGIGVFLDDRKRQESKGLSSVRKSRSDVWHFLFPIGWSQLKMLGKKGRQKREERQGRIVDFMRLCRSFEIIRSSRKV